MLWLFVAAPVAVCSQIDAMPYRTTVDPATEVDQVMVTEVGVGVAAPVTVIVIPFVVAFTIEIAHAVIGADPRTLSDFGSVSGVDLPEPFVENVHPAHVPYEPDPSVAAEYACQ